VGKCTCRPVVAILLASACQVSQKPDPQYLLGSSTLSEQPTIVDVASFPDVWTAAEGWTLNGAGPIGDLDGDGYTDAMISATRGEGSSREDMLYFVYGPLHESMTFPGDEDISVSIAGWGIQQIGEATGDGVLDLDLVNWDGESVLLPGPFQGGMDVATVGIPHSSGLLDFNGDGILDQFTTSFNDDVGEVHLTWGPASRWSDPPDVVIAPQCDGYDFSDWDYDSPRSWPDVSGDGVPELWVAGYGSVSHLYTDCAGFLLPLPESGTVNPASLPNVPRNIPLFDVLPDQTGDGIADVYLPHEKRILASPVTFSTGGLDVPGSITSSTEILIDPGVFSIIPQEHDFDGDGLADFLVILRDFDPQDPMAPLEGPSYLAIASGGGTLSDVISEIDGDDTLWDLQGSLASGVFVENGVASVFVMRGNDFTLADLVPATPVQ
jgi:hypothetical protein